MIGMMDHNEDDLNVFNRKGLPDLMDAALRGTYQAYHEAARPTADLIVPALSELVGRPVDSSGFRNRYELTAIGLKLAKPAAETNFESTPQTSVRYLATVVARVVESSQLDGNFSLSAPPIGTLSVWPSMRICFP